MILARIIKYKNKNTITVLVKTRKIHKKYRKYIYKKKKYIVQNNIYNLKMDDKVIIQKIPPKSKLKKWKIIKKII